MRTLLSFTAKIVAVYMFWLNFTLIAEVLDAPFEMARGIATGVELHNIRRIIMDQYALDEVLPDPEAFRVLVSRGFRSPLKPATEDFWGYPYAYSRFPDGFEVRSAGPDSILMTDDDLVVSWTEDI